jgi:hypothetical protein
MVLALEPRIDKMLNDGPWVENDLQTWKRRFFFTNHEYPPVVGSVLVLATDFHRSKRQYLVLVTVFGPMMKLGDGNLLFVHVMETTH